MKTCEICGAKVGSIYSVIAGYEGELLNCGACLICKCKFDGLIQCFKSNKIKTSLVQCLEHNGEPSEFDLAVEEDEELGREDY